MFFALLLFFFLVVWGFWFFLMSCSKQLYFYQCINKLKCFLFICLVPIALIAAFRRMKKLTQDHSFIAAALRESSVLVRYSMFPFKMLQPRPLFVWALANLSANYRLWVLMGRKSSDSILFHCLRLGIRRYIFVYCELDCWCVTYVNFMTFLCGV